MRFKIGYNLGAFAGFIVTGTATGMLMMRTWRTLTPMVEWLRSYGWDLFSKL